MKTRAVRLYGAHDLRLEEFELSPVGDDGVRCKVISDSLCMSSYKALQQGAAHKRVPDDVATNPTIIGHEFCGIVDEVGKNWAHKFKPGDGFVIQPAHSYKGSLNAPGYSYPECGGDATYVNIPWETLTMDCLLPYNSDVYFFGSLAEPMSCIIATFHAMYHTRDGAYIHDMGIVEGGKMALLAGVGPMGGWAQSTTRCIATASRSCWWSRISTTRDSQEPRASTPSSTRNSAALSCTMSTPASRRTR